MQDNEAKTDNGPKIALWAIIIVVLLMLIGSIGMISLNAITNRDPLAAYTPPPPPPMPNPNALDYYVKAQDAMMKGIYSENPIVQQPRRPGYPQPPQGISAKKPTISQAIDSPIKYGDFTLAEKEQALAKGAKVDELIHQGFAYPCQTPSVRSLTTLSPQYGKIRALARYLHFKARVKAEKGDWGGSMDASLDCFRLGVDVQQQGTMIGMLVGVAAQAIGRGDTFWETPNHLNREQTLSAMKRLQDISAKDTSFADVLREEKYCMQAGLLEIFQKRNWRAQFNGMFNGGDSGNDGEGGRPSIRLLFVSKGRIMKDFTTYMDQLIARAELPYAQSAATPLPTASWIIMPLVPVFDKARRKQVVNQTQNDFLLVMLALHAYHLEHGEYPSSLTELTPAYLQKIPDDLFAQSGSLKYIKEGSKYRLYSVGSDGKDDDGKAIDNPKEKKARYRIFSDEGNPGDIVAGINVN